MEKAREILRLHNEAGMSQREIAAATGCSVGAVNNVITKVREAGVGYPIKMTSKELGSLLYPPKVTAEGEVCPEPDLMYIHKEIQQKGMTLTILWEEYKEQHPNGLMYTQFCARYRKFRKENEVYMRKIYKAGDQAHIDWCGQVMNYHDEDGEHEVSLFVAGLPASSLVYTRPYRDKTLKSWIDGHVHAFEYFGGVPRIVIPDNDPAAVNKADYYDPLLNKTYEDMGRYYGVGIMPTKSYSPTHKSPVEKAVQIVERRIIARLRKRQFTSYEEICLAVAEELEVVNNAPFQKMPGSRRDMFEEVERKMLNPLPAQRYEHAEWKTAKVSNDYHVQHGKKGNIFFYSVPYSYAYKQVDVRITTRMIEIFYEGERIALHQRRYSGYQRYSTQPEHMPNNHKVIMEWSPARFKSWAGKIGPQTKQYITKLLEGREFPEQAYKTCMGILHLASGVSTEQMEDACKAAMNGNVYTYKSFKILLSNRDEGKAILHENVRGNEYYGGGPDVG